MTEKEEIRELIKKSGSYKGRMTLFSSHLSSLEEKLNPSELRELKLRNQRIAKLFVNPAGDTDLDITSRKYRAFYHLTYKAVARCLPKMVGFQKHDTMTSSDKLVAGVTSGIITRFMTQPMDVIKVRAQLIKRPKKHSVVKKIATKIWTEEGISAFWHGHALGQVHSILGVSSQFYIYEMTTKYAATLPVNKSYKFYLDFMCGVIAGCGCTTLVIPLEVIRVRQILVNDQYRGLFRGAKNVYKSGGFLAFYEGLGASLLQMGPSVGISFTTFTFAQQLILKFLTPTINKADKVGNLYKPQDLMLASSIAGSIAGFVSKTLTYPFDLAKRRLMMGSHIANTKYRIPSQVADVVQCKSMRECFYNCYRKEGLKGFFRGWTVTIYKSQLTSIVAFTSYEMMCFLIREL